jgi:hypothetical protein
MKREPTSRRKVTPWVITAVAGLGLVAGLARLGSMVAPRHPDPRPGVSAQHVLARSQIAGYADQAAAYEAARRYPLVLDGLYCHCDCTEHFGHRSLLTCFESQHGASCDICIGEAILAARMHQQGATLDQIRQAVDAQFGS